MTPVLGSIAALSLSGALGSEVAAQQCGSSGDLIYIGRTRGEASSVWLSTTARGDFRLEAAQGNTTVDNWSQTRSGPHLSFSPFVSNGSGGVHRLFEVGAAPNGRDCLVDTRNQRRNWSLPGRPPGGGGGNPGGPGGGPGGPGGGGGNPGGGGTGGRPGGSVPGGGFVGVLPTAGSTRFDRSAEAAEQRPCVTDRNGKLDSALCDPLVTPPLTEGRDFAPPTPWNVWTDFTFTQVEDTRGVRDLDVNDRYFAVGIDRLVTPALVLGVQAEFDNTDSSAFGGLFEQDTNGWAVGPYFALRMAENWTLNGLATVGQLSSDVSLLGLTGDFDRMRWRANLQATGEYEAGNFLIRPSLAFDYYRYEAKDFDLSGALLGIQRDIIVELDSAQYSTLTPEVEVSRPFLTQNGVVAPFATFGATYWIDNGQLGLVAPSVGQDQDDLLWSTRLGVRARMGEAVFAEASFGYLSLFEDNLDATDASVFLSVSF
ncbi:autotransporter outer membrane beta-barrel domain-containing protein [Ruegeria arenilitoris]|uniref:autotransporter outer membrane beta-barrel domain-containing protein n=1 Tax=Ruegeria arenilitoris TaxID=1173585 RepID=UPI00147C7398|nr:autotransporter outer membrane beta-barrel domain-containing protein [Ruegeria arenilitoris]